LDGIFEICGVPKEKFLTICSSIDKLDKMEWEKVKQEMIKEKGLEEEVADKLQKFVELKGNPMELLNSITEQKIMDGNKICEEALKEMRLLFEYCECFQILDSLVFDLSLARGLNYYTGIIFEAILTDTKLAVGSIGGGGDFLFLHLFSFFVNFFFFIFLIIGRYDNLTQMFGKNKVPCIGFSVGVERIFAVLMDRMKKEKKKESPCYTKVYVASMDGCVKERMQIVSELWKNGINAEMMLKVKPSIKQQLSYADDNGLLAAVIIGGSEVQKGVVQIKDLRLKTQKEVARTSMVEELLLILNRND
jgi:histidyl-tRNA synthetase